MTDQAVVVPDLAGWRKTRVPQIPQGHRFEIVPDWVCEILPPATESWDRDVKHDRLLDRPTLAERCQ